MSAVEDAARVEPAGALLARAGTAQHGVVARWQLLRRGLTVKQIDALVARRHLVPLYRGVYAVGHERLTRRGRWMAAVLACGPGAVLSHRTAAVALDLLWDKDGPIEVTRPRAFRPHGGLRCHRAGLRADEVGEIDGVPVTSPFRTVLDLAAVAPRRDVELALSEIKVRGLTDRVSLDALVARHEGWRGVSVLRSIRASKAPEGVPRNVFEDSFIAFIDRHGLPRPATNAALALRGCFYEIDALWRPQQLAAELDGRAVHGTDEAYESDRERDRVLLAHGWRTTRITWRQLHRDPVALAADLRLLLTR